MHLLRRINEFSSFPPPKLLPPAASSALPSLICNSKGLIVVLFSGINVQQSFCRRKMTLDLILSLGEIEEINIDMHINRSVISSSSASCD